MKITKKSKIIMGVTASVIAVAVIVTAIILTGGNTTPPVIDDPNDTKPPSDVVIQKPSGKPSGTETPTGTEKENDGDPLVLDVGGNPDPDPEPTTGTDTDNGTDADTTGNDGNENTVKQPDKPVETKKPDPPAETGNDGGGIIIGGNDPPPPYKCDTANHNCASPEAHAHTLNLEYQGCPTCGSHSCPSFYALDEWGYTLYTPSKCPQYDVKGDPLHYCQECGKKTGDGTNDTCVRFINPMRCPLCGVDVPGRTCHTCK